MCIIRGKILILFLNLPVRLTLVFCLISLVFVYKNEDITWQGLYRVIQTDVFTNEIASFLYSPPSQVIISFY